MKLIYKHINQETNQITDKNINGKIKWATDKHFVSYPKAKDCLSELEWIFLKVEQAQQSGFPSDLEGSTIIGESGTGKTTISDEFIKMKKMKKLNPILHHGRKLVMSISRKEEL
jgi:ABC-type dipeptide/oligopeptide/nickel transport system ATPase subunit